MEPQQQPGGQLPPPNAQPPQQPQPQPQPGPMLVQPGVAPSPSANPYDFIMNPEKPKKKPIPLPTGNSMLQRVMLVVGGLVVLLIVGIVVASLITSGGKEKTASLLTIAQDQTELIRVSTNGALHTTTIPGQNLAQNVLAAVTSDNSALLKYMSENGQKVTPVQLALKASKTTDTTLTTAQENNTYDSAFKDVIQQDLTTYMSALKKAYDANPGPKGKTLLSKQYDSAETLLKVSKQ